MNFSEESIFFLQNWGTIEKLMSSENNFKKEFSEFLYSIKEILENKDWWNSELVFKKQDMSQIYLSKMNWFQDDGYSIWIGVEGFSPEKLFGIDTPPECYLWVMGDKKDKIMDDLLQIFRNHDELKKYVVTSGGYVLRKLLRKFAEEEYKDFISGTSLNEITEFFEKVYLPIKNYEI